MSSLFLSLLKTAETEQLNLLKTNPYFPYNGAVIHAYNQLKQI